MGLEIDGESFEIAIDSFICDAPARAFILNIKGHTGYFGCGQCTQEGEYVHNRVTFPRIDCQLRTDSSFRLKTDDDHHHGPSELENLPIDVIKQVPYEFMHLVCLGVTRKLLLLWTCGSVKKFCFSCNQKLQLTRALITLKPFIASEFARKPRPIEEIKRWKATELRQFLLYTGPIVLKNALPKNYYDHFLRLHLSITILCSEQFHKKYNNYATSLLQSFVKEFPKLYGVEQVSYNVHGLVHLSEDSKNFGSLDKFSAFKFENHWGTSSLLKGRRRPLEQVYNRICERNKLVSSQSQVPIQVLGKIKSSFQFKNFKLAPSRGNNTCELKSGEIIKILEFTEVNNSIFCRGNLYQNPLPLYDVPEDSRVVGIRHASLSQQQVLISIDQISRKVLALPYLGSTALIPLCHL